MKKLRCRGCRKTFTPNPRLRNEEQHYCGNPLCQRKRRRQWQKKKRRSDPDYRETEQQAQKTWAEEHPDYSKNYRAGHPEYVAENLQQQHERDAKRRGAGRRTGTRRSKKPEPANVAAKGPAGPINSGTYELKLADENALANGDAMRVEIVVISDT